MDLKERLEDISRVADSTIRNNCWEGQYNVLEGVQTLHSKTNEIIDAINNDAIKGDKGDKGDTGATGSKGDKGDTGKATESIEDSVTSPDKTWSSTKIVSAIDEVMTGLEDVQGMKYETTDSYKVLPGTKNGVIKDLKLYGKSLVNIVEGTNFTFSAKYPKIVIKNVLIKTNTKYVFKLEGDTSNVSSIYCGSSDDTEILIPRTYNKTSMIFTSPNINFTKEITFICYTSSTDFTQSQVNGWRLTIVECENENDIPDYFTGIGSVGNGKEIEVISNNNLPKDNSNYKEDKKILLYKDEDKWKPILNLRGIDENNCDIVDSDKYIKKMNISLINGSENWIKHTVDHYFKLTISDMKVFSNSEIPAIISDKFVVDSLNNTSKHNICLSAGNGRNDIYIYNANISSIEDFKTWLKSNNFNMYYVMSSNISYETNSLELKSYDNETMYMINSGPVSPKSEFYVDSNLSSILSNTIERVKSLENEVFKITKLIRSVLNVKSNK